MAQLLYRLGKFSAKRAFAVIAIWVLTDWNCRSRGFARRRQARNHNDSRWDSISGPSDLASGNIPRGRQAPPDKLYSTRLTASSFQRLRFRAFQGS